MVYAQGSLSELVEYDDMMAYVLFWVVLSPHARLKTQQTPKDEAQVPDAVPPLLVHSEAVKHVPL
jgi:hypothetical protein